MNTRRSRGLPSIGNRFFTQPCPIPPGFDAAHMRNGTVASGPADGRRNRENRYVYWPSSNSVSSSNPII